MKFCSEENEIYYDFLFRFTSTRITKTRCRAYDPAENLYLYVHLCQPDEMEHTEDDTDKRKHAFHEYCELMHHQENERHNYNDKTAAMYHRHWIWTWKQLKKKEKGTTGKVPTCLKNTLHRERHWMTGQKHGKQGGLGKGRGRGPVLSIQIWRF